MGKVSAGHKGVKRKRNGGNDSMAIAIELGKITVKLFGAKHSPAAYAIRDFLQRNVVAFEWIDDLE